MKLFSNCFPQQFGIFFPNIIMENLQQNIPFFGSAENSPPQKKKKLSVGGGSSLNGRGEPKFLNFACSSWKHSYPKLYSLEMAQQP